MDLKEKRLQKRFPFQLKAKLSTHDDEEKDSLQEEIIVSNISSGGAFLQTKQKLPMASKVFLEFCIAFEHLQKLRFILSLDSLRSFKDKQVSVKATAVVIRAEEDGIGIIFDTDYQLTPMKSGK